MSIKSEISTLRQSLYDAIDSYETLPNLNFTGPALITYIKFPPKPDTIENQPLVEINVVNVTSTEIFYTTPSTTGTFEKLNVYDLKIIPNTQINFIKNTQDRIKELINKKIRLEQLIRANYANKFSWIFDLEESEVDHLINVISN